MTLVEVVAAIFVFSIFVVGMFRVLVVARETSDRARDHYVAINLAKNRLERARAFDFSQLYLFAEAGTVVDHNGAPTADGRFRRITTVTPIATNLVEMAITVQIKDRFKLQFGSESEELSSYLANLRPPPE